MVEQETLTFLADLALDNRKVWMDAHRTEYDDVRRNCTGIAMTLHSYADRYDHDVADAKSKPKQSYSKLSRDPKYRDGPGLYRPSIDVFSNAGHPAEDFGYFLHIEPGNCYAGAGLFQPTKAAYAQFQERVATDQSGLDEILEEPDSKATFSKGLITQENLATVPKGLNRRVPASPHLKVFSLTYRKDIPDASLLEDDAMDILIKIFRTANPLVRHFGE